MSVKAWEPTPSTDNFEIDAEILQQCIRLSETDQLDQLSATLPGDWQTAQKPLMTLERNAWNAATDRFSNDQLIHLVRFFTAAEMQLDGWEAAEKSPVIWLVKILRKRKAPPSRELLLWIKQNSNNRFLPNGAL